MYVTYNLNHLNHKNLKLQFVYTTSIFMTSFQEFLLQSKKQEIKNNNLTERKLVLQTYLTSRTHQNSNKAMYAKIGIVAQSW